MNNIINLVLNSSLSGYEISAVALMVVTTISVPLLWWYGMGSALRIRKNTNNDVLLKLPFKFESFVKIIGGNKNVLKAKAETSKVKIWVNDISDIDFDLLKSLKSVTGTFKMSDSVTVIIGRTADTLAFRLNEINNNEEEEEVKEIKKS